MQRSPVNRHGLTCLLLAVALSGCTATDPGTVPQGPGKSFSSYLTDVNTAVLTYEKRCGLLDASREAQRKTLLMGSYPQYLIEARDTSAQNGRTSYDSSCVVSGLKDAPCSANTVDAVRVSCAPKETAGRLDNGRNCRLPEECQGFCKGIPSGTLCGSGVCAPKGKVGDACPEGPGACNPASSACSDGFCVGRFGAGGGCKVDGACQDGLICIKTSQGDASGKCGTAVQGKQGDPCGLVVQAGMGCAAGLSCYVNSMGAHVCQPTIKQGQTCATSEACEGTTTCVKQTATDATGTCQPLGGPGDKCSTDIAIGSGCELTLRCFTQTGATQASCTFQPESGQPCHSDLPCLTGLCDQTQATPTCRALYGTGLACRADSECQSGLCESSSCKVVVCL